MKFPAGAERFIVTTRDGAKRRAAIYAYDVTSGRRLWQKIVPGLDNAQVLLDPTGRWFGYQLDKTLRYQIVRFSDFAEFGATPERCLAIAPSGNLFAIGDEWGLSLCDQRGPAHRLPLGTDWGRYGGAQFSPDGKLFAMGTKRGIVFVADIEQVRGHLAGLQKKSRKQKR